MRRMAGLDLDGWHDHACRGWSADGEATPVGHAELIEGGHASVVVQYQGTTVGGPQAVLSPIGRGGGWGEIGYPGRRRSVAELWSDFLAGDPALSWPSDLRATTDALTRHAQDIVFCIPDRPQMDEARQQGLLDALAGARRPRVTLLWRPVAMLLGWLEATGTQARSGMRIACLQQSSDGIELQFLTLRNHEGVLVPERAGIGAVVAPHLGLRALYMAAEQTSAMANGLSGADIQGRPRLPADQLFAPCPAPELEAFRLAGTDWRILRAPAAGVMPDVTGPDTGTLVREADVILLSTPLAERHHAGLRAGLRLPMPPQILPPGTAARGGLLAARRIARGIPHYLDQLDQVALVVLRQGEPVFEDLIPAGAIVAGNREYVSEPITNMVWGPGMVSVRFFLRKGPKEIRRWVTPEVPAPEQGQRLIIQLRQRPAQGWAALSVGSMQWEYLERNPIRLDWQTLEQEDRSEEEILEELRPKPIVPERVHQHPGIIPWIRTLSREGLTSRLAKFDFDPQYSLAHLAAAFRQNHRQPDGSYIRAIGTDGEVPPELSVRTLDHLQRTIETLTQHLQSHVSSGVGLRDNNVLLVLTWMFERCPAVVTQELIRALECAFVGRHHVFLAARSSAMVVMHGVGRIVHEEKDLVRLIPQVVEWLDDAELPNNNGVGLLAALLSRPASTPQALMRLDLASLAQGLLRILERLTDRKIAGSRLKYTLIAIVGLLRIREYDAWALVANPSVLMAKPSPQAAAFLKILQEKTGYLANDKFKKTRSSIAEIVMLLKGRGGRSDIFKVLDDIEDQDD